MFKIPKSTRSKRPRKDLPFLNPSGKGAPRDQSAFDALKALQNMRLELRNEDDEDRSPEVRSELIINKLPPVYVLTPPPKTHSEEQAARGAAQVQEIIRAYRHGAPMAAEVEVLRMQDPSLCLDLPDLSEMLGVQGPGGTDGRGHRATLKELFSFFRKAGLQPSLAVRDPLAGWVEFKTCSGSWLTAYVHGLTELVNPPRQELQYHGRFHEEIPIRTLEPHLLLGELREAGITAALMVRDHEGRMLLTRSQAAPISLESLRQMEVSLGLQLPGPRDVWEMRRLYRAGPAAADWDPAFAMSETLEEMVDEELVVAEIREQLRRDAGPP